MNNRIKRISHRILTQKYNTLSLTRCNACFMCGWCWMLCMFVCVSADMFGWRMKMVFAWECGVRMCICGLNLYTLVWVGVGFERTFHTTSDHKYSFHWWRGGGSTLFFGEIKRWFNATTLMDIITRLLTTNDYSMLMKASARRQLVAPQ